jgi:ABC-type multidrug transport system fused ATPase/permease subunit
MATRATEAGPAMIDHYRKLLALLMPPERRQFHLLVLLMLVVGLFETAGVASILPFMAVLSDPDRIESHAGLSRLHDVLGFTGTQDFLVFLGICTFVLVVLGILAQIVSLYAISRFSSMRSYVLSSRLLLSYLRQPYTWFLNRHTADLGKAVLSEVDSVVYQSFLPGMKLISNVFVSAFIAGLLIVLQPMVAIATAVLLSASYGLIFTSARKRIAHFGTMRFAANAERYRIAQEATGGIKDVKLLGLEDGYIRRFQGPALRVARAGAARMMLGEVPRYLLQGIAFGGMLLVILALLVTESGSLAAMLPILGVYAFAGLRLLPALQQIYAQTAALRFNRPALDALHRDLAETEAAMATAPVASPPPIHLRERIDLVDVHYSYPLAEREALRGLSLTIPARSTVGIVGGTGAGKTTAVDLMLGLLAPDGGRLEVDGVPITRENLRAWQNTVGYVPQQIFLTDDTVAANIALGLPAAKIDMAAVERAARIAEIHGFVTEEMPQGYMTMVGERGVRLSGGQRQRIGIARALYRDPDVLIMDEATSALDNLTERAVMDAVHNIGHAKTVVLIAHRLSTVQGCDTIFMIEYGRLIAQGSYAELLDTSQKFRAMAAGLS